MGVVGFGAYRISIKSKQHKIALEGALASGCRYIDTSSNYTGGESELLIGSILREHPEFKPEIITKGGYIQGENLARLSQLQAQGIAKNDVVNVSEFLKHSIHPDFLNDQLERSLERLGLKQIDCFLLHNPEYYFQTEDSNIEEFHRRIRSAFEFLEQSVSDGKIKKYGISSNNFVLPPKYSHSTKLAKIKEIAETISSNNHFKVIQFPFNLLEVGALEKLGDYGDESLLELARKFQLETMINRPLNAFSNDQLLRLATYDLDIKNLNEDQDKLFFKQCLKLVEDKWNDNRGIDDDSIEDFYQIPLLKQFSEIWNKLPTPDAVDQVYHGYMFPFIARVWGEEGLTVKESQPFYKLYDISMQYSKKMMTEKAKTFQKQAADVGLVPISEHNSFAVDVIETYLNYGFDVVLVGMKNPRYVDELKHLF